ncbi:uncharacterized protein N7515_006910 [Penicillium bovifimosum]|uniref:Uncharacterized protein n=1 Tax=Penicillium bovifimosum TaxID=126998 RepID=A0A9W9GWW6_9EURO|nr:uncharacterized protein N7515_006910 [Penicillium bovifimosum]KAJ5130871.1 hypothetical protein N7515_006910 [Penicillium bovifimosum]
MHSSSHQRASTGPPRHPSDPHPPLMDLSSLEGPPIADPPFILSPDTTSPRITTPSPTPTHILRSKPLPPRPVSRNVTPSQHQHRRHEQPSECPNPDGNSRQMPARKPTNSPSEELAPDCDPRHEHESSSTQSSPRPRQPRPCVPLTWLEDEKKWVVGEAHPPTTRDPRFEHAASSALSPVSPMSSCSPCYDMIRRLDEHIAYNNYLYQEGVPNHSPAFNSHRFHQGYGTALGNERVARWVAMTQRMEQHGEQF